MAQIDDPPLCHTSTSRGLLITQEMAHLLINDSETAIEFSNPRTMARCRKRFQEKFLNPIVIYTPLLANVPQIYFLLSFTLITMAMIIVAILVLFHFNPEVKKYFMDMTKKTRTCRAYNDNLGVFSEWIPAMRSSDHLNPVSQGVSSGNMQHIKSSVVSEAMQPQEVLNYMPSKSKYDNFTRRGTVVRMHLPFAHDLASFISMVDGKM
ncbi:unnamed protein product [Hydatigera taeniaeformis]|uniref:Uncharacterized protein n=1 Tax=Hydatigena taeniaeformis TaxID=6205 RepID=A0A0R3WX21_HYDTA|nr:unnamed protein product [Hydatigera taeniaeformis]